MADEGAPDLDIATHQANLRERYKCPQTFSHCQHATPIQSQNLKKRAQAKTRRLSRPKPAKPKGGEEWCTQTRRVATPLFSIINATVALMMLKHDEVGGTGHPGMVGGGSACAALLLQ